MEESLAPLLSACSAADSDDATCGAVEGALTGSSSKNVFRIRLIPLFYLLRFCNSKYLLFSPTSSWNNLMAIVNIQDEGHGGFYMGNFDIEKSPETTGPKLVGTSLCSARVKPMQRWKVSRCRPVERFTRKLFLRLVWVSHISMFCSKVKDCIIRGRC